MPKPPLPQWCRVVKRSPGDGWYTNQLWVKERGAGGGGFAQHTANLHVALIVLRFVCVGTTNFAQRIASPNQGCIRRWAYDSVAPPLSATAPPFVTHSNCSELFCQSSPTTFPATLDTALWAPSLPMHPCPKPPQSTFQRFSAPSSCGPVSRHWATFCRKEEGESGEPIPRAVTSLPQRHMGRDGGGGGWCKRPDAPHPAPNQRALMPGHSDADGWACGQPSPCRSPSDLPRFGDAAHWDLL